MKDDDGDDGDDNDDGVSSKANILDQWKKMQVMENHDSPWEYGSTMVHLNQVFPNWFEMKDIVARWTVTSHWEVWVTVSTLEEYSVKYRTP